MEEKIDQLFLKLEMIREHLVNLDNKICKIHSCIKEIKFPQEERKIDYSNFNPITPLNQDKA